MIEDKSELFYKRTLEHIERVKNNALIIYKYDSIRFKLLLDQTDFHDASKFKEPEFTPYVQLSYYYSCKRKGISCETDPELKELIKDAVFHHIKNNRHHPEYYFDDAIRERDGQIIDATKMPAIPISEMVCDWMAMSQELNNSVVDFADSVVNKKFIFSPDQVTLIYDLIGVLKDGQKIMLEKER
jgi:hypothetical protein